MRIANQKAFFSLKFLFLTTIFGFAIYCSFWIGRFYFDYYSIKDAARNIFLEAHTKTEQKIRAEIKSKINRLGTPIFDEDIKITNTPKSINLKIKYNEYLFIGDYSLYKFDFVVNETRYFKK